jgi:plasmid stabilization system protein ParE
MPYEVTWLPQAAKDVERLRGFLKSKNPVAAQRAAKRILEGARILQTTQVQAHLRKNLLIIASCYLRLGVVNILFVTD